MKWYNSFGKLEYSKEPIIKLVLQIDQDLSNFYRKLIPKYLHVNPQAYKAHVSVIMRGINPPNMQFWEKYQNHVVDFEYCSWIFSDEKYYWLSVVSPELEKIRNELGIESVPKPFLNKGQQHIFHMTIGNTKG